MALEKDEFEDELPEERKQSRFSDFVGQHGFLIGAIAGIIAILFLLGPVIGYELDNDTVGVLHLWDYFIVARRFNWTMYATLVLILGGVGLSAGSRLKAELATASAMSYLVALCFLVLAREFFVSNKTIGEVAIHGASIGWGLAVSMIFVVFGAIFSLSLSYHKSATSVKTIAEDGLLIAMAFALNFVKIPLGPTGGSANLQMLPLFIIAIRHGPAHGLVAGGIAYGLLTCLTDGYGFASFPFDYLIGFGSVAVAGFFRPLILGPEQKNYNLKGEIFILVGCFLATFIRFVGSTASSMLIWDYPLGAAAAYNVLYVSISGAIAAAILMGAYGPLCKLNRMFPPERR